MKRKRTLFSMVVFIAVFWISMLFNIKNGTVRKSEDSAAMMNPGTEAVPMDAEAKETGLMASSYDMGETASQNNKLYQQIEAEGSSKADINTSGTDGSSEKETFSEDVSENRIVNPYAEAIQTYRSAGKIEAAAASTQPPKKQSEVRESKYKDIGISIAGSYVNVRQGADTGSEVLGKLHNGAAAKILDTDGEWYHVESGSVKGYVKAEYLKTGIPEEELIDQYGVLRISVGVDGLNVREKPDTESEKLTVIYQNEKYPVIELLDEWVKIDVTDDKVIGYVKREYIELIVDFRKAVSKEEELELLRLKEEERIKKETEVKYRDEVDYTREELKLLACLVHAEAGNQSYEGKLAVANIVLNRVKSKKYPDTIKEVIYQPGQFSVANSGSLAKQLKNYDNYSSKSQLLTLKAAKAALSGANNIGSRLYFHSYKSALKKGYDQKKNCVKLEDHLFW